MKINLNYLHHAVQVSYFFAILSDINSNSFEYLFMYTACTLLIITSFVTRYKLDKENKKIELKLLINLLISMTLCSTYICVNIF